MDTMVTPAEVDPPKPAADHDDLDEAMPRVQVTRQNLLLFSFFVVSAIAFLYFVLPQIAGLEDTWNRIDQGDPWWLAAAFVFTILSFGGYVLLFQGVFVREGSRIDVAASYQITMAGLAATRLFAAGGAGGIALTAWALRRSGMPRRTVADKTLAFLVLTYVVYAGALVIVGFGLYLGVLPGNAPFAITVVPAIFGLVASPGRRVSRACRPTCSGAWRAPRPGAAVWPGSRSGWPTRRPRPRRASARRSATCARAIPPCSARSPTGRSTSRSCGPRSTRSATRRSGP